MYRTSREEGGCEHNRLEVVGPPSTCPPQRGGGDLYSSVRQQRMSDITGSKRFSWGALVVLVDERQVLSTLQDRLLANFL